MGERSAFFAHQSRRSQSIIFSPRNRSPIARRWPFKPEADFDAGRVRLRLSTAGIQEPLRQHSRRIAVR
jgi:hypothetical protein